MCPFTLLLTVVLGAPQSDAQVYHDMRIIHDATQIPLHAIARRDKEEWLVGCFTQRKFSGAMSFQGAYIDARTGKTVMPDDVRPTIAHRGEWGVIVRLNGVGELPAKGDFTWQTPANIGMSNQPTRIQDFSDPILCGGTAICRYNRAAEGREQFAPTFEIPTCWAPLVKPALERCAADAQLLSASQVKNDGNAVVRLLADRNDVIAVVACGLLARSGALEGKSLKQPLLDARGYRQAVFIRQAMLHATPAESLTRDLLQLMDEAPDRELLEAVVLASAAIRFDVDASAPIRESADNLLRKAYESRQSLAGTEESLQRLDALLSFTKIADRLGTLRTRQPTPTQTWLRPTRSDRCEASTQWRDQKRA